LVECSTNVNYLCVMKNTFILRQITQASRLFRSQINAALLKNGVDLTSEMYMVMNELWRNGDRRQWELAEILFKDKGGITKIVDNLVKRDLVHRVTVPEDKRNNNIVLTKKGIMLESKIMPAMNELYEKTVNELDDVKLKAANDTLELIIKRLG
jgi:DNA-binding MarR family transcriptional regulator